MDFYPPCNAFSDGVYILQPWPKYLNGKPHTGVDIYGQRYKDHRPAAVEPGKVIEVFPGSPSKVSRIVVQGEATGTDVYYKHVSTKLKKNDIVMPGELLGEFDETGKDSGWWHGSHLHFEIHSLFGGKDSDPIRYLLELLPKMIFYMRDPVKQIYSKKSYFDIMNIKDVPWK